MILTVHVHLRGLDAFDWVATGASRLDLIDS